MAEVMTGLIDLVLEMNTNNEYSKTFIIYESNMLATVTMVTVLY